jgi:hypothetical protein
MRVKCISNDVATVATDVVRARLARSIRLQGADSTLALGCEYCVQAVEQLDGGLWFYLHTVDPVGYPHPYPAEMFEILDCTVPDGWCLRVEQGPLGARWRRLSFAEWAQDDIYYEKLVDDDIDALRIYRSRMVRA